MNSLLFKGRMNRGNFIIGLILGVCLFIGWAYLGAWLDSMFGKAVWLVVLLDALFFIIWAYESLLIIRRCHDLNWSRFTSIVVAIILGCPIFYSILSLILWFKKGSMEPNQFGEADNKSFIGSILR